MKKRIVFLILILLCTLSIYLIFLLKDNDNETNTDGIRFKKEYEQYNDKKNTKGKKYLSLNIDKNNIIKYSSLNEIKSIISSGTGVIYLGFPECPWCRNMVPVLLEAADTTSLENIYYLDMVDLRDTIEIEDGEIITTKEATDGYYDLVNLLSNILDYYVIEDSDGNSYNTNNKRIYVPLVLFIKDGIIVDYHANTVDSQNDPYIELDKKQQEELYNIYESSIHKVLDDICNEGC